MRFLGLLFGISGVAALLAGCAGGGATSVQPAITSRGPAVRHPVAGHSWMSPEARNQDLLYISDIEAQAVFVYSYRQGHKLVGTLTGFFNPEGLCVDHAGDVWVTNDTSEGVHQITEYAHGGTTPIANLNDPDGRANGCSVDPKTGDLAVADFWGPTEQIGNVAVYHHAAGTPVSYSNPNIYYYYYCAYDDKGNLFVDGETQGSVFGLGERVKGGNSLKFIPIDERIYLPGGVQWDGKYLAVGDQVAVKHNFTSVIYQFALSGSGATEVGATILTGSSQVAQFWLPREASGRRHHEARRVIGPNQNGADTLFWDYPAGGNPTQTISGENSPIGATISPART
jgi:hypothetical protein